MGDLRLYFRYLGMSIRGQMQYRASFVLLTISQFAVTGAEYLGIWALFHRFGTLRGWKLPEVALLYGMVAISFALADAIARGFDTFPSMVRGGDFDRVLLRPRSTALQIAGRELQLMRVGRLLQGAIVLGWAVPQLHIPWDWSRALLVAAAILGGACTFIGLFVFQATLSFWTIETLEIMNTLTYGGTETAQYPLSIYRPWFQRFFTYIVPIACVNFLPVLAVLNRPGRHTALVGWLSPVVGIVFLLVCLRIWKVGVRYYCSTGS